MARNEIAKATIYLNGKQAEAALEGLKKKAKELRDQMKEAQKAGDKIKYTKLKSELTGVEAASRSLKKETFDVERVLKDINKVSWRDLEKAQRSVILQMKGMTRGTADYAAKEKDLQKITAELSRTRAVGRAKQGMWSNLANGVNKYFMLFTAGLAAVTGLAFSAGQWIKGIVDLDDSLANVMKTTGMTRKEVRELHQDFKQLNTRTPKKMFWISWKWPTKLKLPWAMIWVVIRSWLLEKLVSLQISTK
jgi:tubulin-specific chaperone A